MAQGLRESTDGRPADAGATVPCVYCREPIAARAFSYWSLARRLVTATCPGCARAVTVPAAMWRRWGCDAGTSPDSSFTGGLDD